MAWKDTAKHMKVRNRAGQSLDVSYDEINFYPIAYGMTPSVAAVVRPLLPYVVTDEPGAAMARGRHAGLGPSWSRRHSGRGE